MSSLDGETRRYLKQAVSDGRRAAIAKDVAEETRLGLRCASCGVWVDEFVQGCSRCDDRLWARKRRTPKYLAKTRAYEQKRSALRRAARREFREAA
jgi:hypothetical protein